MNTPKVVIGAGYGDEGKGLITDYMCVKHGADVVVRFNGGAQAGHTVVTPSGERHVFSHLSAGSFTGATTFLAEDFIVNPMVFFKELSMFADFLREKPLIFIHPNARITTPYDMLINQLAEDSRGVFRHGSCGLGIWETVVRSDTHDLRYHMIGTDEFKTTLSKIRETWVKSRCIALGIDYEKAKSIVENDNVFNNFLGDSEDMMDICSIDGYDIIESAYQVVFEGAQGLLLDQDYGVKPHITGSNTGLRNVLSILNHIGCFDELDVTYVTRCYTTRHGAGLLSNELNGLPYPRAIDLTNVHNTYQGSLRYAYLDIDVIKNIIRQDLNTQGQYTSIKINSNLAVTCLDQLDNDTCYVYHKGKLERLRGDAYGDVGDMINSLIGLDGKPIKSFGPTRSTIVERE